MSDNFVKRADNKLDKTNCNITLFRLPLKSFLNEFFFLGLIDFEKITATPTTSKDFKFCKKTLYKCGAK